MGGSRAQDIEMEGEKRVALTIHKKN